MPWVVRAGTVGRGDSVNGRHDPRGGTVSTSTPSTFRALAAATVLLGVLVSGCGADDPAVCGSVNDLKSSFDDLKAIDVTSSGALSELQSGLTTLKGDFDQVRTDAKSEFASGIDAVESAYDAVKTAVTAATDDPTAATIAAAATALSSLATEVQSLVTDIQATC
jgi:hypothetical protein